MPRPCLAVLLLLAVACAEKPDDDDGSDADGSDSGRVDGDPDLAAGADHHAAYCVACHGPQGEGGSGPAHGAVVPGLAPAELERIINEGTGNMPPIYVPEDERSDLVAYVLATFG